MFIKYGAKSRASYKRSYVVMLLYEYICIGKTVEGHIYIYVCVYKYIFKGEQ